MSDWWCPGCGRRWNGGAGSDPVRSRCLTCELPEVDHGPVATGACAARSSCRQLLAEVLSPKPVVFLDIDGVVNTPADYVRWRSASRVVVAGLEHVVHRPLADEQVRLLFDRALVARVDALAREAGAEVVLSSSWRHACRDDDAVLGRLRAVLVEAGLSVGLAGVTPLDVYDRWEAVSAWLVRNRRRTAPLKFVVLDDYEPPEDDHFLRACTVVVDGAAGFTEADAASAREVLQSTSFVEWPSEVLHRGGE